MQELGPEARIRLQSEIERFRSEIQSHIENPDLFADTNFYLVCKNISKKRQFNFADNLLV